MSAPSSATANSTAPAPVPVRWWFDSDGGCDDSAALLFVCSSVCLRSSHSLIGVSAVFGNVSAAQALSNLRFTVDTSNSLRSHLHPLRPHFCSGSSAALCGSPASLQPWPGHGQFGMGEYSHAEIQNSIAHDGAPLLPAAPDSSQSRSSSSSPPLTHFAPVALIHSLAAVPPGSLHILALGPLTNLALAVKLSPDLPRKLGSLTVMGGSVGCRGNASLAAEFNFHADAEAAHIVLRAFEECPDAAPIRLVTWELCERLAFDWSFFDELCSLPSGQAAFFKRIHSAYETLARNASPPQPFIPCDLLAAVLAFHPELVTKSRPLYGRCCLSGHEDSHGALLIDHYGVKQKTPNLIYIEDADKEGLQNVLRQWIKQ